jgi:hypothetical protein
MPPEKIDRPAVKGRPFRIHQVIDLAGFPEDQKNSDEDHESDRNARLPMIGLNGICFNKGSMTTRRAAVASGKNAHRCDTICIV